MGARGPLPGSGEITKWVTDALKAGNKSRYELTLGCTYPYHRVSDALQRLMAAKAVVARAKKECRGRNGLMATIYELRDGVEIADLVVYHSTKRRPEPRAIRGLENAWHAIVER